MIASALNRQNTTDHASQRGLCNQLCVKWVKPRPNDSNISTHHRSQQCCSSICKIRPNDRNIQTLQITTFLGATCCTRLATLLQRVATGCELKIELLVRMPRRNSVARTWPNGYNIIHHSQMLHEKFDHFQIWANHTQHVATHRNRAAKRTQHVAPNNVAICYD